MYCFNANNGNSIWTYTAGDVICSTPAIEYGNVYFGCLDAKVYCIDAIGSGGSTTKKWDYTSNPVSSGFFGSPALANDRVYIGSTNDHLYCLNAYGSGGTTTGTYFTAGISPPVHLSGPIHSAQRVLMVCQTHRRFIKTE